jgi:tetratricopeptide (TPR) repeat protein
MFFGEGFIVRRLLLSVSILFLATPAHAEWWEARTQHFVIYSQDDESDTKNFATQLERYDNALRSLQSTKFEPITADWQRVTIFRSGDIDDIGRLAHSEGVAGFYKPELAPVEFTPVRESKNLGSIRHRDSRTDLDPRSVLFHEYAHHFMFQYFPAGYPSWYIEAFAETLATIDLKPDGSFHLGNPPQYRTDALFHSMMTVTPKSLLASTSKPDFEDFYGYYSVGWLMNHYLTFEPTRKGQLQTYLKLVDEGVPSPDAARKAFGDLDKLNDEIIRYKNKGRLYGVDVRPANSAPPQVAMRKLSDDEEAVIGLAMRTKAGVTHAEAGGVAGDARDAARRYPNSYPAQIELAEAEFDAEHFDAAEAAADRAIQLRPDGIEGLIWKGHVLVERGKREKNKQDLEQARIWLAKAHDEDTKHPAPLLYNYLSYYYSGEKIPESALVGLEQAYLAAPHFADLRLILSRQLLSERKGDLARDILLPIALDPHVSKTRSNLHEVIDLIDARKIPEAYTALATEMAREEEEAKKN